MKLERRAINEVKVDFDGELDFIDKVNDGSILNVFVNFSNGTVANYILQNEIDGNKTLFCRWKDGDKIVGWFDPTIKEYEYKQN